MIPVRVSPYLHVQLSSLVLIFILLGTRVKQGKAEASQGMEEQWLLLPGCERSTSLSCLP